MTVVSFFEYAWPEPSAWFWSAPQSHAFTSALHSLPQILQGPTPPRLDSSHLFSVSCSCDQILLAGAPKPPSGLQNRKGGHIGLRVSIKPALAMGEQAARNGLCITPRQWVSLLFLELQSSHLFDFLRLISNWWNTFFLNGWLCNKLVWDRGSEILASQYVPLTTTPWDTMAVTVKPQAGFLWPMEMTLWGEGCSTFTLVSVLHFL